MKKALKRTLVFLISVPMILIFLLFLYFLPYVIAKPKFQKQLVQSLPIDTTLIEVESDYGRFHGTGDGTEFLAIALIKTDLKKDQLMDYFTLYNYKYAMPYLRDFGYENRDLPKILIQIEKASSLPVETEFISEDMEIEFFENTELDDFSNVYFVVIYDSAYPGGVGF